MSKGDRFGAWIKDNIFQILALIGVIIGIYTRLITVENKVEAHEKEENSMRQLVSDTNKKVDDIYKYLLEAKK